MLLDADRTRHDVVGEDTWDLFEEVERSFDVQLGDYFDLAGIRISELAEKISTLANYPPREKCLSAVAFYRLRHALERVSTVPTRSIRPGIPVADILPWSKRRQSWKHLEVTTGLTFPGLVAPLWLFGLCLLVPASLLIFAKRSYALPIGWVPLIFLSLAFFLIAFWLCVPLARALPVSCTTVGGLTEALVALNYSEFAAHNTGSSVSDIERALLLLTAFASGLAVSDLSPATRIPQDLGIY